MNQAPLTLRTWLGQAARSLLEAGVEQAEADAAWIACSVLGVSRGELEILAATRDEALPDNTHASLEVVLARRVAREPLWHILGTAPFMGLELAIGLGVFSPRPETELLAHMAITELFALDAPSGVVRVCDVGAGSGALGLAIATSVPHASVVAIEPSADARVFLTKNIDSYGDGRVSVLEATAEQATHLVEQESLDMVVSNPPYLDKTSDWVDPETATYDPDLALFADDRGLAVLRQVVAFARHALRPEGLILLEHGISHNQPVAEILVSEGFTRVSHHNDMTGRPRFTRAAKA